MRKFFEPAPAPIWVREMLRSIRRALTDIWPAPLRLKDYAGDALPPAAQHKQGLVYDGTTGEVKRSDGSAWAAFSTQGHGHIAADLSLAGSDRLLGRSSPGAGDGEEIACTSAGRSMIAAADAGAQRALLRSGCMVRKSAAETGINASSGGYFLSWDSEVFDDGGYHDNATNNSRLTTLAGQARVRVGCTIVFANVAPSSQVNVAIYRNGSAAYDGRPLLSQTSPSATLQPSLTIGSGPLPVNGGTDYFQVALFCSDTVIDVTTGSSFWIEGC